MKCGLVHVTLLMYEFAVAFLCITFASRCFITISLHDHKLRSYIMDVISILLQNYAGLIPCKGIRRQLAGATVLCPACLFVQVFGLVKNRSSLGFDIHSHHFMTSEFCQRGATADATFFTDLKT